MSAKPLRVAVLAHDGTLLGYVTRKPTNANWRNLNGFPRVILRKGTEFPSTRECVTKSMWTDAGLLTAWTATLYEGEQPPPNMEAL